MLLIIFIITVPVVTHSVKLDLPRATNQPNVVEPRTITIAVTADGLMHWRSTKPPWRRGCSRRPASSRSPRYTFAATAASSTSVSSGSWPPPSGPAQKLGFVTDPDD